MVRRVLPASNCDIDIQRIKFDQSSDPTGPFGSENGRSGAAERVKNDVVASAAIPDQVGDQCNWLYGWMKFKVAVASLMWVTSSLLP
jgi:hypothetical protein